MYKKCDWLKKLKTKIIKRKIKRRRKEKGGSREWKENSTEQQKPNVEAEVYSNNKKCD